MRCRGIVCGSIAGVAGLVLLASVALTGASGASPTGLTKISSDNDVPVSGTDNIYGAGQSTPPDPGGSGGGELPVEVGLSQGVSWISFSKVTGSASFETGESNGPDGNTSVAGSMASYGPISGISDDSSWFFLTGVFIDTNDLSASGPAPATPNFTGDHSFPTLSPVLDQQFFIGDGLTGTGSGTTQYFQVPTGATDLYLGFPDSYDDTGAPGFYSDNSGTLSVNVDLWSGQLTSDGSTVPRSRTLLGGLDVAGYCAAQSLGSTQLAKGGITGADYAYNNWECTGANGLLTMGKVCAWEYPANASAVVAKTSDPNDAFAWQCYVAATRSLTRRGTVSPVSKSSNVAPIASSLGTPREVFHSMSHNLTNAVITVVVILFITFPAIVFNNTFSSNYAEILLILAGFRRRIRRAFGLKVKVGAPVTTIPTGGASALDTPGRASRVTFVTVLLLGAILGGLLSPKFGFNTRSLAGIGSTLVAFAFGALVGWFVSSTFRQRHHYPMHTYLKALPLGLGVAALCVLVSRLTSFEPGYLYGIVVSIGFVETLEDRHNAHLTTISTLSTLAIALVAWFLWLPANHFALEHATNIPLAILDDVLASIFVGGLVGTVIGLLPLEFMPGGTIAKWRKDVWAGVFFVAVFLLLEVELRPAAGPTHPGGAPITTAVILFMAFGGGSFWMRHYFARRQEAKAALSPVGAAAEAAPGETPDIASEGSADHDV